MSPPDPIHLARRRLLQAAGAVAVTGLLPPMPGLRPYRAAAAGPVGYSARAMDIVRQSLVIDMLAPLKLDFEPEAYTLPATEEEAATFGYDDMPEDQRKQLMESYKSSYAFREKLDTDGFDHPRKIFDLTEALVRRGYSDDNIAAILGGNFRRLLAEVWKTPDSGSGPAGDGS